MALPTDADVPLLLDRLRPGAIWGWKGGAKNDLSQVRWEDLVQVEPIESEYDAEWTMVLTENAANASLKSSIKAKIDALEGVSFSSLTNAQVKDLLEAMVFVFDGLATDGTVKKAVDWTRAVTIFRG